MATSTVAKIVGGSTGGGGLADLVDDTSPQLGGNLDLNSHSITGSAGTLTTNVKVLDLSVTWNNAGVTFTGLKLNVTDSASNAASLLMDLQVGGASKFSVTKAGAVYLGDGTAAAPALSFGSQPTFGFYRVGSSILDIVSSSNAHFRWNGASYVLGSLGSLNWTNAGADGTLDLRLLRDAAGSLAQCNSTNAQTFNIYNTYTDASNYERGFMKWNSNVLEIGAEAAGTGTKRNLRLGAYGVSTYAYLDILSAAYITTISAKYGSGLHGDLQIGEAAAQSVYFLNTGAAPSPASMSAYYRGLKFGRSTVSAQIDFVTRVDDTATAAFSIIGNAANASAITNLVGGAITISAGNGASGSSGDAHGGNLNLSGGTGYGTGHHGYIVMSNLPTSSAGLPAGALWNNSGVLTVA